MRDDAIVMLAWSDYVGITRCRAVPASHYAHAVCA
jgi:hypothetical protein